MSITKNQFLEEFKKILSRSTDYSEKVLVRSSVSKLAPTGGWRNCLTMVRVLKNGETLSLRDDLVYDIFALFERIILIEDFMKIFGDIEHGFKISEYSVMFNGQIAFEQCDYLYSHNQYSEWPGHYFSIGASSILPPGFTLVKYKTPCFNGYEAIKEWFTELRDFHMEADSRFGKLITFIPNFKARIKDIQYSENTLKILIEGSPEIIENLDCQLNIRYQSGNVWKNLIMTKENSEVITSLEEEPIEVYIQLATSQGEMLDYYRETPFTHTGKKRFIRKMASIELLEKIDGGENDQIEFKPFLNKRDPKEAEIIKTVVAFANTKGGSILVGVDDYGQVKPIHNKLLENLDKEKFVGETIKHIRKTISDKVSKKVVLDFLSHDNVRGEVVLEIKVEEGTDKPVFMNDRNLAYIRKGSTNRHPNEDESKRLFGK